VSLQPRPSRQASSLSSGRRAPAARRTKGSDGRQRPRWPRWKDGSCANVENTDADQSRCDGLAFEPNSLGEPLERVQSQLGLSHEPRVSTRDRPARTGADWGECRATPCAPALWKGIQRAFWSHVGLGTRVRARLRRGLDLPPLRPDLDLRALPLEAHQGTPRVGRDERACGRLNGRSSRLRASRPPLWGSSPRPRLLPPTPL
jgi:hypothetical protein